MKYLLLIFALSFTGCATSPEIIHVEYVPQAGVISVPGADKVSIIVRGTDDRGIRSRVGKKINMNGDEMGPISADNDILQLLVDAMSKELKNRGFVLGEGSFEITLKLRRFYNKFKMGLWTTPALADVAFSVEVKDSTGTPVFTRDIREKQSNTRMIFDPGNYAKASLETALSAAIRKVVTDPFFIAALVPVPKQGVQISR